MTVQELGPQVRALYVTRRWLVVMLAALLVSISTAAAVRYWSRLNDWEHVGVLAAVILVVTGGVQSRNARMLWMCAAGVEMLALTALIAPAGSPPWIPMPNAASYGIFMAIALTTRLKMSLLLSALAPVLVAIIWWRHPSNIVASGLALWGGWIVVAQILSTALALSWAWNTLLTEARTSDRDLADQERLTDESVAIQQRAQLWRTTASRLHESLLNSIRYVLNTDVPDRDRLHLHIEPRALLPDGTFELDTMTVDRLLADVLADPIAVKVIRIPRDRPSLELEPRVFEVTRAALIETAHNSVRHGAATELVVRFDVAHDGQLKITATDNGQGIPAQANPGIGLTQVLTANVRAEGGSSRVTPARSGGTQVEIWVPTIRATPLASRRSRTYPPFDKGRLLITAPLAGSCAVGTVYFLLLSSTRILDRTGGAHYALATLCGLLGVTVAISLVLRRQHTTALTGMLLITAPALVPWFLRTIDIGCEQSPVMAAAINVSGFAVIICAAWTGYLPGTVGVITWASGTAIVALNVPATCREGVVLALANSLLVLPITLVVTYVGVRTNQRAADRVNSARQRDVIERSRAAAEADLNAGLHDAVEDAVQILERVTQGQEVNSELRERLRLADARIRAAIQVDVLSSGGFAVLAANLVKGASEEGRSVSVLAVSDSQDQRSVPAALEQMVKRAVGATTEFSPVIHVFTDGHLDYISVVVDEAGLRAIALDRESTLAVEGLDVQVLDEEREDNEGVGRFSILVSRVVSRQQPAPHV